MFKQEKIKNKVVNVLFLILFPLSVTLISIWLGPKLEYVILIVKGFILSIIAQIFCNGL